MPFLPLVIVARRAHVQGQLGIETVARKQRGEKCKGRELSSKEKFKREREKRNEREFLCKRNFKRDELEGKCEKL